MILWMAHFYCLFFQTSLDFSQVLLRNPAVAIDWMLSLKRRFASAYLVSFVLVGTSSSPTRQRQLSWEWRGPLGMPGLRLPGPLSQHVFVTRTPRKHKLTVIWSRLRETFEHGSSQVVEMSSVDRYYRYVRFLPYFQRVLDLLYLVTTLEGLLPLHLYSSLWSVPAPVRKQRLVDLEMWPRYPAPNVSDLKARLNHYVEAQSPPCNTCWRAFRVLHPEGKCLLLVARGGLGY